MPVPEELQEWLEDMTKYVQGQFTKANPPSDDAPPPPPKDEKETPKEEKSAPRKRRAWFGEE